MLNKLEQLHLAKLLKRERNLKGFSSMEVAKAMNMSQVTVLKIEKGGNAKEGNYFRYGKFIGVKVLNELVEFRKKNDKNYGKETIVRFPYKVGSFEYQLQGVVTEMPNYTRIVTVTLMDALDYKKIAKRFPLIERVAVAKTKITEVKGGK